MQGSVARVAIGFAVIGALALVSAPGRAADPTYVGVNKCKTCHKKESTGDQYGVWKKSSHAKAYETLLGEKAIAAAKERGIAGPPSEAPECLKCHATAYGLEPKDYGKKPLEVADGVQCETCHGPGSAYRKKSIMEDREKAIAHGLIIPDEKTCLRCHNDESPSWDPMRYTLADGSHAGFDFDQAYAKIKHPIPEVAKGKSQ